MGIPTIYPVHPRNQEAARRIMKIGGFKSILFVEPVGYLDSNTLVNNAQRIVTDSGGVQREAFFAEKPCITVFDYVAWPETMAGNCNQLAKPKANDILEKRKNKAVFDKQYKPFGDGHACERMCDILRKENILR
jgi:UDP-N-acetylglucosamine 2-epimerase (non-hydrolysing)/UDP-GlcNAc3NAcA epimerase